jgi:hypothetical protein
MHVRCVRWDEAPDFRIQATENLPAGVAATSCVVDDSVTDCQGTQYDNESEQTSHGDPRRSSFTVVLDAMRVDGRLRNAVRNSHPTTDLHVRMIGRTAGRCCSPG